MAVDVRRSEKISELAVDRDSEARFDTNRSVTAATEGCLSNWNDCSFGGPVGVGTEAALSSYVIASRGAASGRSFRSLCFLVCRSHGAS